LNKPSLPLWVVKVCSIIHISAIPRKCDKDSPCVTLEIHKRKDSFFVGLDYSQHDEHYGLAHVGEREIAEYEEHIREKETKGNG